MRSPWRWVSVLPIRPFIWLRTVAMETLRSCAISSSEKPVSSALAISVSAEDEDADRGAVLVDEADGSDEHLQGALLVGAAEGERSSGVAKFGGGTGCDQGGELGPAGGIGGNDPVDADTETV